MTKKVTQNAQKNYWDIADFIFQDNPTKAGEFLEMVEYVFINLPDFLTYKPASPNLPQTVREMPVKGFKGYTLRIIRHSDGVTYLLSAHRPGLTDDMKNRQTIGGLKEL